VLVQLVAFSQPRWQLNQYLLMMGEAGFSEWVLPGDYSATAGRLWRQCPNRKWYAAQREHLPTAKELILIHKIREA